MRASLWSKLFLEEASSLPVSAFRIPVALAVGAQFLPALLEFQDNYSPWAFVTKNTSYFPPWMLELVDRSPQGLVVLFAALFWVSWLGFLAGLYTQWSGVLMFLLGNYFYALNHTPHGMLSIDILLVTVLLMVLTPYPGDHFSLDALRRARPEGHRRTRPLFLQRLLQIELAVMYFHTGLCKILPGNWLSENPYHYLMNTPAGGIVRDSFFLKAFLASRPELCYLVGLTVVLTELASPFLLFIPRTRWFAIGLALFFQLMLFWSLHVPTTAFLFVFPFQLFLFIHPDRVLKAVEGRRALNREHPKGLLLYDGQCGFCRAGLARIQALDLFGALSARDLHAVEKPGDLHPALTREACLRRMQYLEGGRLYDGFHAFRRMALRLPMLYPLLPFLWLPGMGRLGRRAYDFVARNRHRIT